MVHDGTFTYTYNVAGRLVQAQSITATLLYTYTADGLRVGQSANGAESRYAWDWATAVPEVLAAGESRYLVGAETLGWWEDGAWAYILPDALGSVRQEVDGAGAVVQAREWTPYGVEVGGARPGLWATVGSGGMGRWGSCTCGRGGMRRGWGGSRSGMCGEATTGVH